MGDTLAFLRHDGLIDTHTITIETQRYDGKDELDATQGENKVDHVVQVENEANRCIDMTEEVGVEED